jgi:HPt (histidine-containing phosphotransfer) domain-containing protein
MVSYGVRVSTRQRPVPETETSLIADVFDQIQQAMKANPAGFTELYRDYLTDAWKTLPLLRAAVVQGDRDAVFSRAHYIKSSSLVLGAKTVACRARELEDSARTSDTILESSAVDRVAQALHEVQTELAVRLGAGVIPAPKTAA